MKEIFECYIEEYNNGNNVRLRFKESNIKVSFEVKKVEDKSDFLKFLSSAKLIPLDVYSENGTDYVLVKGNCVSKNSDEVILSYDDELVYLFQ